MQVNLKLVEVIVQKPQRRHWLQWPLEGIDHLLRISSPPTTAADICSASAPKALACSNVNISYS